MTRSRHVRAGLLLAVTALLATTAACGGSDDDASTPSTEESTPATEDSSASPEDSAADTTIADESTATSTAESPSVSSVEETSAEPDVDRNAPFRFALNFGNQSFDPHRSPSAPADTIWMAPVYERLVTLAEADDGSAELVPQLATEWEVADDAMSVEFTLREGVVFQDGTPFNADAVKANIDRALEEDSTVKGALSAVEGVDVIDESHVVFRLNRAYPSFPWVLTQQTAGMMVSPAAFDSDLSTAPVGTGPYKLVDWQKDSVAVYERWEDYRDVDSIWVSELSLFTVADPNARVNGVRSGTYDATLTSGLDVESSKLVDEGFQWQLYPGIQPWGILTNTDIAPMNDVRVRRAISMALDRETISEQLYGGFAAPHVQPFAEGLVGYDPEVGSGTYDVDAAKALIQEAGAEGATIQLLAQTNNDLLNQVIQQQLGEIGLNVELDVVSPTEGYSTWYTNSGHAGFIITILGDPDPTSTLERSYIAGSALGTPDPELIEMTTAAQALPLDSEEREQAYQEISAFLVENPVQIPIVQFYTSVLANEDVVGLDTLIPVSPIGRIEFRNVGISN